SKEIMEVGQARVEDVELHDDQRERREREQDAADHRRYGKEPADVRVDEIEESLGIHALEPEREDIRGGGEPFLALTFAAALHQLLALTGRIGDHESAAMEHANKLLQFLSANRLRREVALEAIGDFVEAGLAIEHLQDGELFFLKPVILQANR